MYSPTHIDDIYTLLYRARQYQGIRDDGKASEILSDAADRCTCLLEDLDPDGTIEFEDYNSIYISNILQGKHSVLYLNHVIEGCLCHDKSRDRDLIPVIAVAAEVDLQRKHWPAAIDAFSYALLTSIRHYGIQHESTANLLHGLGRARLERNDFRDAERALRAALDAYMRLDRLEEQDKRKVAAVVHDLNRALQAQKPPTTRRSDVCTQDDLFLYLALTLVVVIIMDAAGFRPCLGIQAKSHTCP